MTDLISVSSTQSTVSVTNNTTNQTQTVVVGGIPTTVTVAAPGPQGPVGPQGPSGYVAQPYNYVNTDFYPTFGTDGFIDVDCGSGPITITLPLTVSEYYGYSFSIKKYDTTSNPVIITTTNGQTIDNLGATVSIISGESLLGFFATSAGYRIF